MLKIILIISALSLSANLLAEHSESVKKQKDAFDARIEELPLDELATLTDVYAQIKKVYVNELSDKEILENAIKGMLSNLDKHSAYLSPDRFEQLEESARGEYGGIGIRADHLEDAIYVRYIFDESPAKKSGLKLNDRIVAIDGQSTQGMSVSEGSDLLRGTPNSKLKLTVISENSEQEKTVKLQRKIIQFTSVSYELIEPDIGYARVGEFQARSAKDLTQAITKMEKRNKKPLKGFILDLRNNPGGILEMAVAVSDLFLHQGVIVYTKGRLADSNQEFTATSGDILRNRPLIVLVNGISASASEIVSGALQDHKRALILGTQSYGKGSVQTVYPIQGKGGGIKITTALYYTPNDRSIRDLGITPDLVVEFEEFEGDASDIKPNYKVDNQVVAAVEEIKKLSSKNVTN
ncbi:S41 family peptidase [Kangiella sp. HZ709]|uniref:S41 family peptidase n=1 Tax=Kangiella sp. HZ709 TaxID=2666328 RepID=UPI0012AF0A80|nr:S41 family peptidase [Kangiella sp. HZ709]MRX28229.1 PDZ domain-containing protein [Kangiella sp. HZ709]